MDIRKKLVACYLFIWLMSKKVKAHLILLFALNNIREAFYPGHIVKMRNDMPYHNGHKKPSGIP